MAEVDEYSIPAGIIRHFDLTSIPQDDSIQARRTQYPGGLLFIDRLLSLAGIDGPSLYPATSPVGYRRLLAAIHTSPLDRLKKDCFYYYLLKDYLDERSERFAKVRCLSKTWRVFIDGYWNVDHGYWEAGINCLTNPGITEVNFPSEIINTLAHLAPPVQAMGLIHTFLLTRQPSPSTPSGDVDIYTVSLAAASSVPEAFSFIRSIPLDQQSHLREVVWSWAFGAPSTPCGLPPAGGHTVSQKAIKEILHLPLLPHEDAHLLSFLLHPPRLSPESLSLLHDLVTLRLIHQGKYAESLELDKALAGSGGNEESRQRRREMVREFIAILPECQRRVLEVDSGLSIRENGHGAKNGNGYMEVDGTSTGQTGTKSTIPAFPLNQAPAANTPKSTNAMQTTNNETISKVASPAPQRVVSTNSPFSGPPRFAPTPNKPSPIGRVLSGSPFTLPMSIGANAVRSASSSGLRTPTQQSRELPIPRPKVRPAPVEDEDEHMDGRRKRARVSEKDVDMDAGADVQEQEQQREQDKENDKENEQETEVGDHRQEPPVGRDVGQEADHDHSEQTTRQDEQSDEAANQPLASPTPQAEPEPLPEPTPRTRRSKPPPAPLPTPTPKRSTRTSIPPPSPMAHIPGSFNLTTVPEDQAIQPKARRSRTTRDLSTAAEEPPTQPRSRMTRSVSRAISIDRDDPPPPPVPQVQVQVKRARSRRLSGASLISEVEAPTPRGTRTRKTTGAGAGAGASPTPSVRSTRAGSQTPRKSTRAKK